MNWDQYYLAIARTAAGKSKDPSTQVGACLVDQNNIIAAVGFNGFPRGVPDDAGFLANRDTKLRIMIHAEENALLFARRDVQGGTMYVWPIPPCARCAAKIIQAGIVRVVAPEPTLEQWDRWGADWELADWLYAHAGVNYEFAE
jgi:dCMP deaminase